MAKENATTMDQDKEFINEFIRNKTESVLRDYEKKHRARIIEAPFSVKDAFDRQWKEVTGNSYFQPITTVQPPMATFGKNNTERSDPRSRRYMARVQFDTVFWQLIKRKIGKKFKDLYIIEGKVSGSDEVRPIFQNLTVDRLKAVLGPRDAERIISDKAKDHGEITGDFNILCEGYWEVIFMPVKSENEPIDVRLMWEGQCLIIKRMVPVVLPGFYLEVADNATRDHFIQTPEQGRKKIGVIQEYPYTVTREATRDEFLKQKAAGDAIMREKMIKENG